jgi:rhodanese-related sulfurtransferase
MNTREKISAILIGIGIILAVIPLSSNRAFTSNPGQLLTEITGNNSVITVDQVARMISTEDSTLLLIDLRTADEFATLNIPGSVNIPYKEFLDKDPGLTISDKKMKYVFYSNGDINSSFAVTIARGMNYDNTFSMKGGLNGWFETVMNTSFTGERISARENALFESRTRARRLFTEINSLPDSLKVKFIMANKIGAKKLDGGCE